jgi:hypothetical protein
MKGHWTDHLVSLAPYIGSLYTVGDRIFVTHQYHPDLSGYTHLVVDLLGSPLQEAWSKASVEDLPLLLAMYPSTGIASQGHFLSLVCQKLLQEPTP